MPSWAAGRRGDSLLRVGGLLLLAVSFLAIGTLLRLHAGAEGFYPGLVSAALAAIGFLGGSCGSALVALGHHLWDEVEIAERWRPRLPRGASPCSRLRP